MSYLDQSRHPSASSMIAVVTVHAALAAALLTGLTVSGVIAVDDGPLTTITPYKKPPPPPDDTAKPANPTKTTIVVPIPPLDLKPAQPKLAIEDIILPPLPPVPQPGSGTDNLVKPLPTPSATGRFTAIGAKPRNDPGSWLSNADYRPSWARAEMVGTARFRLEIAANGKVSDCQITGSTGHAELDAATCTLVSKRARFQPARDTEGAAVSGTYAGSVRWQLPD